MGSGLGPHPADARVYEPHAAARGARKMAARLVRDAAASAPRDHLRDQPATARCRPAPFPRRRGPCGTHEPDRRGSEQTRPHGQPRHRGLAQHERRGGDPLRAAALDHGERPGRDVPRALQQQDQWRHAAALADADEPGPCPHHHRGHRRGLDHRPRRAGEAQAACRRQGLPRGVSRGQASGQVRLHRLAPIELRADGGPGHHLRLPREAHPRIQASAPQCIAHRRALQPLASEPEPRDDAADVPVRRQGGAGPVTRGRLTVAFLPEYSVSLAQRLIPATDVSNQISTAGYEASGTSNMKFMMNGALTIGTRDGATIEMAQEAGEENFFLFGLTAEQVAGSRGWYNPHWHYEHEPETRAALDLIFSDHFSRNEPGVFTPLRDTLLTHGDHYMHLADLQSYLEADQNLCALYAEPEAWARKAILNVASSGKFSSDRTIAEYAADIWHVKPCPVA